MLELGTTTASSDPLHAQYSAHPHPGQMLQIMKQEQSWDRIKRTLETLMDKPTSSWTALYITVHRCRFIEGQGEICVENFTEEQHGIEVTQFSFPQRGSQFMHSKTSLQTSQKTIGDLKENTYVDSISAVSIDFL